MSFVKEGSSRYLLYPSASNTNYVPNYLRRSSQSARHAIMKYSRYIGPTTFPDIRQMLSKCNSRLSYKQVTKMCHKTHYKSGSCSSLRQLAEMCYRLIPNPISVIHSATGYQLMDRTRQSLVASSYRYY